MKSIIDYMDDLKEKTGSDYRSAKILNIQKTTISNIRKRQLMSDETAIKLAEALGVDQAEVLIAAAIARSSGDVLKVWEKISEAVRVAASFLFLIQGVSPALAAFRGAYCILCKIGLNWRKRPGLDMGTRFIDFAEVQSYEIWTM